MTKRKVSTKTKGTKDKPVDAEIRRAAERAGIKPERATRLAHGDRDAVIEELKEAREVATERAVRAIAAEVGDAIVQASELLSAELAEYFELENDPGTHNIGAAHHRLWEIRWRLGLFGGSARAGAKHVERIAGLVKQEQAAAGDAS